jgi:23S rRNA (guanosine2251-2'-O)-methyltransferase
MRKMPSRAATFLYGKNSVYERMRFNPKSIKQIFLKEGFDDSRITDIIRTHRMNCKTISLREFSKVMHSSDAQGVVAEIETFKYKDFNDVLHLQEKPILIFLDHIYDPQNLGVILRVTACFGRFVVIIPKHDACEVTDSVLHVASGGENYTPVCMVGNVVQSLELAKKVGYWIVGTGVGVGEDITKTKLPYPLGVVMGSEGKGIRPGVKAHIDKEVFIPMKGAHLSLNVAVACAVLCYEAQKQKE